jgi:uncharacterized protein YceK
MKKLIITSALAAVCILVSGCASIVDGRDKTVNITSNPAGATVKVFDKNGKQVSMNTTPTSIRLKRNQGYFVPAQYKLVFEAPGYYPSETQIKGTVNPWYLGNVVLGGLIGIVIIDPATGAMWTFSPNDVNRNLVPSTVSLNPDELMAAESKANPTKVMYRPAGKK